MTMDYVGAEDRFVPRGIERPARRRVEGEVTDQELKENVQEGVEVLDLNDGRNQIKRSTWY
jgi:hypothetical protein